MIFAPRRVAGTLVLLLAFVGCGPRAAVSGTSSPTPDCSPQGVSVTIIVTRVVAVATAVGVVSQIAPGGAETPTTVPRAQLVAEAVATATAVARIPTPTPQPTSTPTPQPAGTPTPQPACATLVSGSATAVAPSPTTQPAAAPTAGPKPAVGLTTSPPPAPQGSRGAPAPAPSPGATTLVSPSVLLASDAGAIVELHVGERFVLLLGQYTGTDWRVQLSDPSVLQRVGSDGQGIYQAAIPGQTELTAIGDPLCRRAQPPCAAPSRLVQFVVRVQ